MKEVINNKLPFTPTCPKCQCSVSIEKDDVCGYYVKCEKCNSEWAASPFPYPNDEIRWLEQFHSDNGISIPKLESLPQPGPSDTKIMMEIAHASDTLKKAYDLVCQAYDLINEDKVARQYIKFNSKVVWHQFVWDILMKQFNQDNPDNKNTYHLRAFDYYGIQPGMLVGDGEVEGN
jgi:hypothetical protein